MVAGALTLAGLYLVSQYNYLLFHSLAELFSIAISLSVFVFAWNTRRLVDNNYLLFLGISFLFISLLDILHTLGYTGMGIFPGYGTNLPSQLWIATRALESMAFVIAPLFLTRKLNLAVTLAIYTAIFIVILASIFVWHTFPTCFIEGQGLTPFKKSSEYLISSLFIISMAILWQKKNLLAPDVFRLLRMAIALKVISELFFTLYISAYGLSNLIGHYFKIISFYLLYRAVIATGLNQPYALLFRNLLKKEQALKQAHNELEMRVEERTEELATANWKLQQTLAEVKTLRGIIPICMHCKNIRDDEGYWNQLEKYLAKHSDAQLSHGICDAGMEKFYPDADG